MKSARLALSAILYTVSLVTVLRWPAGQGGASEDKAPSSVENGPAPGADGENPASTAAARGNRAEQGTDGVSKAAAVPVPAMDQVFKATGLDRMLLMARFIQTATPSELEAAIDRSQTEGGYDQTFSDQLWLRWVELDRDAALKHKPSGTVWWAFAKVDPGAALEVAGKSGPQALGSVIFSIAQGDPVRARQLLAEHPEVDSKMVNTGIVEGLEHQDAGAAVAFALESGAYSLEAKFKTWMARDPEEAETWVKGLADPVQRRRMEDLVLAGFIAENPGTGLEKARQLPPGLRQVSRTVEAIAALALDDPETARAAAETMPTPRGRQKALAALARALTSSDPAAATAMLPGLDWRMLTTTAQPEWSYSTADGQTQSSGYGGDMDTEGLVAQLMSADPRATADALAALPVDSGAPVAMAVEKWAARQPEAASSWLKDLPAGPVRDAGIGGLTRWLVSNAEPDYPAALAWAVSASPELQEDFFNNTFTAWKDRNPEAAVAAVDSLPVSAERKARILERLK